MPIELRILSGARAGRSETFDKPTISVGRNPSSDLRFDPTADIDVSALHAEIRATDRGYSVHDLASTNGTFVNGERIPGGGSQTLRQGDVIAFGAHGPTVAVHLGARLATAERVAVAVKGETRRLRIAAFAGVVAVGALGAGGYWIAHREVAARDVRVEELIEANEQASKEFQARLNAMHETALATDLARSTESLTTAARNAHSSEQTESAQQELERSHALQRMFNEMDLPAVRDANDSAVVLIMFDMHGKPFEATGFSVNSHGLIVTNRHVVRDSTGATSTLQVKFANTSRWHRAHLVKTDDDASVDLALIQVDDAGTYPAVKEIATSADTPVGGTIATIGFPLGTDLTMEGAGADLIAKTSLTIGTVSKSVPDVLQIDAFAAHGSSGSPVFDGHGHVVGVVWGGPPGAAGRIVYAVPGAKVAQLVAAGS
ncbi:MAG TPA: trypsin-like peptidase domain-containing protein [Gemmatimonadaceae bacterium]|jgi:S1-C subfamily serine protease